MTRTDSEPATHNHGSITFGIRPKLALVFSLVIVFIMLLIVHEITVHEKAGSLKRAEERATMLGNFIAESMGEDILMGEKQRIDWALEDLTDREVLKFFFLVSTENRILSSNESELRGKYLSDSWSNQAQAANRTMVREAFFRGEQVNDAAVPLVIGDQRYGVLRLGFKTEKDREQIVDLLFYNLTLATAFLLLGIVVAYLVSRTFLTPITDLLGATIRIGRGDFFVRTRIRTSDEFEELGESFNEMTIELQKKELLKKYISQTAWEEGDSNPGALLRSGKKLEAAVLFSDVRGFTAFSERHEPEEAVEFLNRFFEFMVRAISLSGGVVDKFVGDSIMGIFLPNHPSGISPELRAVHAALRMKAYLREFNLRQSQLGLGEFEAGIGINAGPVILGNVGADSRFEFTAMGETVNLAARLEAESRERGPGLILIPERMVPRIEAGVETRPIGAKRLPGSDAEVALHQVVALRDLEPLLQRAGDPGSGERETSIRILGISARTEARDFLIDMVQRASEALIRTEATKALSTFAGNGDGLALKFLLGILQDERDEQVLATAVSSLALVRSIDLVPTLKPFLGHSSPRVRANAIEALMPLDFPEKTELFLPLADDSNHRVSSNAMLGLWSLGNREVIGRLLALLHSFVPAQRAAGAYSVGILALSHRFRALFHREGKPGEPQDARTEGETIKRALLAMLKNDDPTERMQAATALGLIGDLECMKVLEGLHKLEESPAVASEMVNAVVRLGSRLGRTRGR